MRDCVHYKPAGQPELPCRARLHQFSDMRSTEDIDRVTCKNCLRIIDLRKKREAMRPIWQAAAIAYENRLREQRAAAEAAAPEREPDPVVFAASRLTHFKPAGWLGSACQLSPQHYTSLVFTHDPYLVECASCRKSIGAGSALRPEQLREVTVNTLLNVATKADLDKVMAYIDTKLRELATELRHDTVGRLMNSKQCADYLGKSVKAVYNLKKRGMPHTKPPGSRVMFERELIDKWLERNRRGRRGGSLGPPLSELSQRWRS